MMDVQEASELALVDQQFLELTAVLEVQEQEDDRITVALDLPYMEKYGRNPHVELVYGCGFPVGVGDRVLCPPTPRGDGSWWVGTVVALNGGDYRGPVKYVRPLSGNSEG